MWLLVDLAEVTTPLVVSAASVVLTVAGDDPGAACR